MVRRGIIDEQLDLIDERLDAIDRRLGRRPWRPELQLVPAPTEPASWVEILEDWGRRVDHLEGETERPTLRLVGKED